MAIEITARHAATMEAVREHAQKRAAKLVEEFPQIESIHVILDVEKYRHIAEIVVQAKRHVRLETREDSTDMYASIDAAVAKIEARLRRTVDKKKTRKLRPPATSAAPAAEEEG